MRRRSGGHAPAGTGAPARERGRWIPVVVDLAEPLGDLPATDAVALHVTALWRGQPLGNLVLDVVDDPFPAAVLGPALRAAFADAAAEAEAEHVARGPVGPPICTGSVVVCTRNRFESLQRCLTSLTALAALSAGRVLEVVVVDNGEGDDATRDMVEAFGYRWVHEPLPGLDRARNRGLLEARADVVLYTDDDVEVSPSWADELLRCFDSPLVAVATGLVLPAVLDTHHQRTFEQYAGFSRGVRRRRLDGARTEPTRAGSLGAGASMAFRRTTMRSLGGFPEALDAGMPTKTGGDTYGLYRVLRAGYHGVYEPRALAFHWHRDGPDELVRTLTGYSTGAYSFLAYAALRDRDPAAVRALASWTRTWVAPRLVGALLSKPGAPPLELAWAEVRGAVATPGALRAALRLARERGVLVVGSSGEYPAGPQLRRRSMPVPERAISLSVVIDGRGDWDVRPLLTALAGQSLRPDQVVLALGGDEQPVLAAHAGLAVDVVRLPAGAGDAAARNSAAGVARGDVLLFLDGDSALLSRHVLAAHLAHHCWDAPAVAAVGPRLPGPVPERAYALDVRNAWIEQAARVCGDDELNASDLPLSNVSLPTSTFVALHGWRDLPGREGWELGCRLQEAGVPIVAAPAAIVLAPPHPDLAAAMHRHELEGSADVVLAQAHSACAELLPLLQFRRLGPRRRALVRVLFGSSAAYSLAGAVRPAAAIALIVLERVALRETFHQRRSAAEFAAYWRGARRAAVSLPQLSEALATAGESSTGRVRPGRTSS